MKDRLMRLTHGVLDGDEDVLEVEWDVALDGSPRLSVRYSDGEEVRFLVVRPPADEPVQVSPPESM